MINTTQQPDHAIRRYLLGTLTEQERDTFEQALLHEDDIFRRLVVVEDELIDECADGALTEAERTGFLRYLSGLPARQRELQVASALRTREARQPIATDPTQPDFRPSFLKARVWSIAALVLVMVGASYSLHIITRLSTELDTGTAEDPRISASGVEDARAFILRAGTLRTSGEMQKVELAPGSAFVELGLDVASNDHASYRAALYDADAAELFAADGLDARSGDAEILVSLVVPQDPLSPGDYFIVLSGKAATGELEAVARYDFRLSMR